MKPTLEEIKAHVAYVLSLLSTSMLNDTYAKQADMGEQDRRLEMYRTMLNASDKLRNYLRGAGYDTD